MIAPSQGRFMSVEVALAVLHQGGHWLLQLRDDVPGIVAPGCWGLFGGHLDPGETPKQALRRELWEEIRLRIAEMDLWYRSDQGDRVRHVFRLELEVPLHQLQLLEGQDLCLVRPELLRSGACLSPKLGELRPLAPSLQEALDHYEEEVKGTIR